MNTHISLHGYLYERCRLLGHAWHEVPSDWSAEGGLPMTVRCERCDMERRDTVGRNTGEVVSRRYTMPTGYSFSKDEAPRRIDFRFAWVEAELAKLQQRRRERSA
jgi:cytochrome c2